MVSAAGQGAEVTLHRLGGFDSSLLRLEGPTQPMHAFSLVELDVSEMPGGYSFQNFRDVLASRTDALPEFRAKLADSLFNLDTPVWVDDPEFDIDNHIHRLELPAPGGREQLHDAAARLAAQPLDRNHPLWDIWILEGVDGLDAAASGRVAAVVRTHHVFADGVTAGDLWSQFHAAAADSPPAMHVSGFGSVTTRRLALGGLARLAYRPWFLVTKVLPRRWRVWWAPLRGPWTGNPCEARSALPEHRSTVWSAPSVVWLGFGSTSQMSKRSRTTTGSRSMT
jgi:WS/DGAT/MGAT family acyltransferase